MIVSFAPAVVIFIVTLVLAFVSKVLQRKLIDQKKMKEHKLKMKENNIKMKELMKAGDAGKKELAELNKSMLQGQMDMLQSNNKLMLVSLPVFLVFFAALGFVYGHMMIQSVIPLPSFNQFAFLNPMSWVPVGLTMTAGYYKVYFIYYLASTIIMAIIFKIFSLILDKKDLVKNNVVVAEQAK